MSQKRDFASGAIYHIVNRGSRKMPIFRDYTDFIYFLTKLSDVSKETKDLVLAYCLMPNHIHLLIKANNKNSVPQLMQRLCLGHACRYNQRYHSSGHLYESRYKAHHVDTINYLRNVSRYIHRNPIETNKYKFDLDYVWSSYPAYIGKIPRNRIRIHKRFVLCHFESIKAYQDFCEKKEDSNSVRISDLGSSPGS